MKKYLGYLATALVAVVVSSCGRELVTAEKSPPAGMSSGASIAVMDAVKVNMSSKVTRSLTKQKDTALEKVQSDVENKRKDFEKREAELKSKQLVLGQDAFMKEAASFRNDLVEYDRATAQKVAGIEKAYVDALSKVQKDYLDGVVADIGRANGYDLVINAQTTILLNKALDITDEVIKALDAKVTDMKLRVN